MTSAYSPPVCRREEYRLKPWHTLANDQARSALYAPGVERDSCGVGFVASTKGPDPRVVPLALTALRNMAHRGAVASDDATGDGAGVLVQLPRAFFAREAARLGAAPRDEEALAVGMFFLPGGEDGGARPWEGPVQDVLRLLEEAFRSENIRLLAWRDVPVRPETIGRWAARTRPRIVQAILAAEASGGGRGGEGGEALERRLFKVRKRAEASLRRRGHRGVYIASLSCRAVVYKGLLMATQLEGFYPDLSDPDFVSSFALFHQRYSTNTEPSWERAQPLRCLAHNGEINTLQGNMHWMLAREPQLVDGPWADLGEDLLPVIDLDGSDSAMLDNVLELLTLSGRDVRQAMMMLIPEAWEGVPDMDPALRDFYRYHAGLMEPWDGPAAVAFTDGRIVGAALDRNGLRPMRYTVLRDGLVVAASEVGAVEVPARDIVRLGKLGPGQMIAVDTVRGVFMDNEGVKREMARSRPYSEWLRERLVLPGRGEPLPARGEGASGLQPPRERNLERLQVAFGYTSEELTVILRPMVETGKEPVGSMGDDTPPAVLSAMPRPLFHYFKQRFAEVTNPPIDHIRERLVFSLTSIIGPRSSLLRDGPEAAHLLELPSPFMDERALGRLFELGRCDPAFRVAVLSTCYPRGRAPGGLPEAVADLCRRAEEAARAGYGILVLSDREVGPDQLFIPSLMAVSAVHHHLRRRGLRMRVSIVVDSGEPREIHHLACLLGYGANAVCPYLALDTAANLLEGGKARPHGHGSASPQEAYLRAAEQGLLKVMSRMGISTVESYIGAQIFEAVGLNTEVVESCFPGTASRVEGIGFAELEQVVLTWHTAAYGEASPVLRNFGFYKFKKDGEVHDFSPQVVKALHEAVRLGQGVLDGDFLSSYERYRAFARLANEGHQSQFRHLLGFRSDRPPIPIEEVEPVSEIVRRFSTAQMSLGALSPEAHETLAIAMNRLGARSGSGEGGEDPARYGTERNSAAKQVASGRFGVTPAYLASAQEIQIKMAQGSKPGEGGQIPGDKVNEYIAALRHTVPGVALISPPPHHDIYSIEDLAQLIYDMKRVNPEAEVSVKLVAQTGVGIIAAGVVKARADVVLISGHAGGTGSSPLNSIKNAGLPWEIGLAETQQTLLAAGLRDRVGLRVDGGLKTGRDVLIAAMLGADEFSFGTAAMVSEGCIMARVCHTNRCPVGVASQRAELRAKFPGTPENVIAYFQYVAQEVRELLAQLGYRRLDEVIGRVELLEQVKTGNPAADRLDLAPLLAVPAGAEGRPRRRMQRRNGGESEQPLDERLLPAVAAAWEQGEEVRVEAPIRNTDRTVGALWAWEIARRFGEGGLPAGKIAALFRGTAGQSFGAFAPKGVELTLIGQANDYVGKGLAGGRIVVRPDPELNTGAHTPVLVGNTVLYGATSGECFVAGAAGERFAVRNSGAVAVVEGVGDHGCEYMTGGTVVVLGPVGYNFAAGMTGGEAFIWDPEDCLGPRVNRELVKVEPLGSEERHRLRTLVLRHVEQTGSPLAAAILADWKGAAGCFWRISPRAEVGRIEGANEGALAG